MARLGVVRRLCCRLTSPFRRLCRLGITPPLHPVRPPHSTQSNDDFHSTTSNPAVLGNDLIREILKWLPVKSLMRFKCVSKEWPSILSDPSFIEDYSGGFRGPIVVGPNGSRSRSRYPYTMINYLSIDDMVAAPTCEAYHHSTVDHGGEELAYTSVVNGLVCFYKDDKAWLYNIATCERVQIPVSGHLPTENAVYQLGFDPVTKVYKLLRRTCGNCEILIIGVDSSWRFIPSLPRHVFSRDGPCLDGVIYGIEFEYTGRCYLSAFHVADERFQWVWLDPDFFYNLPLSFSHLLFSCFNLLRFHHGPGSGPVLISYYNRPDTVRIDRYSYGEVDRGSEEMWDTEILALPARHAFPEGILPSGKMLIGDNTGSDPPRLFLYDPIKKEFQRLVITNCNVGRNYTPLPPYGDSYYIEESIVSLKRLTSCCT